MAGRSRSAAEEEQRHRLLLPVSVTIALVWSMAATVSAITGNLRVLEIATGPFLVMCGYVFGVRIVAGEPLMHNDE